MKIIKYYTCFRYSVMAGTPEKMVEYLLETRVDNTSNFDGNNKIFTCLSRCIPNHLTLHFVVVVVCISIVFIFLVADHFLNDFLIAFPIFMTTDTLCRELLSKYPF